MPEGCKTAHDKGEVMKLKISKLLLESALIFQARKDVRYCLNGICFMPDGRIASTDGHRAFIGGSHDNKLIENVIIKIGKSPTKRYEYAIIDTKSKIATYHDEAGAMVGAGICEEIDGRFPDIDRVIPKQTKAADCIGSMLAIWLILRKLRSCLILNSVVLNLS